MLRTTLHYLYSMEGQLTDIYNVLFSHTEERRKELLTVGEKEDKIVEWLICFHRTITRAYMLYVLLLRGANVMKNTRREKVL